MKKKAFGETGISVWVIGKFWREEAKALPTYILEDHIHVGSDISVDFLDVCVGRKAGQNDTVILFDRSYHGGWVVERNTESHTGCHSEVDNIFNKTQKRSKRLPVSIYSPVLRETYVLGDLLLLAQLLVRQFVRPPIQKLNK